MQRLIGTIYLESPEGPDRNDPKHMI